MIHEYNDMFIIHNMYQNKRGKFWPSTQGLGQMKRLVEFKVKSKPKTHQSRLSITC